MLFSGINENNKFNTLLIEKQTHTLKESHPKDLVLRSQAIF